MIHHRNLVAEAAERAVRDAHVRAAVVRALAAWETWVLLLTALFLYEHFSRWAAHGFQVQAAQDAFAFYAQEAK